MSSPRLQSADPMPQAAVDALAAEATVRQADWLNATHELLRSVRSALGQALQTRAALVPPAVRAQRRAKPAAVPADDADDADSADEPAQLDLVSTDTDADTDTEEELGSTPLRPAHRPATPAGHGDASGGLDAYLRRIRSTPLLGLAEEQVLVRQAQAGSLDALNRLVSFHLHIVPPVARPFVHRGLPLDDLIEEGNLGLFRAVARFDVTLGNRFSTYARWWVKHEIRTAVLNTGRLVRLPIHVYKALSRVRKQLEAAGHPMPLLHDAPQQAVVAELDAQTRFTLRQAHELLQLAELPLSLDHSAGGDIQAGSDADATLLDSLADDSLQTPEQRLAELQRTRVLAEAIDTLGEIERDVLRSRYGLGGGEVQTLERIGTRWALTAERVRQLQKQALLKVRDALARRGHVTDELL